MKVSIAWLGIILLITFFLYFAWYGKTVYESFAIKEGFVADPACAPKTAGSASAAAMGIQLTTCPAKSKRYINDKGFTMCCNGQVESGHCYGESICSLSESAGNVPTCSEWLAAYLAEKATGVCPCAMPNYYLKPDGSVGCTDGKLTAVADAPADPTTSKTCVVYGDPVKDAGKLDSCLNAQYLESSKCFTNTAYTAKKALVQMGGSEQPALVSCAYGNGGALDESSGTCYTDDSVVRNKSALIAKNNITTGANDSITEWKSTSADWDPMYKLNFCSVVESYKLAKTQGTCDTLKTLVVFPEDAKPNK